MRLQNRPSDGTPHRNFLLQWSHTIESLHLDRGAEGRTSTDPELADRFRSSPARLSIQPGRLRNHLGERWRGDGG